MKAFFAYLLYIMVSGRSLPWVTARTTRCLCLLQARCGLCEYCLRLCLSDRT